MTRRKTFTDHFTLDCFNSRSLSTSHHLARSCSSARSQWLPRSPLRCEASYSVPASRPPYLAADLYGRGYSDAPQTTYDASLYVTQLALLLQYIGWQKVNVVGLSMGGAIATSFVDQFPHLVTDKLALIASAGILEVRGNLSLIPLGLIYHNQSRKIFNAHQNFYILRFCRL